MKFERPIHRFFNWVKSFFVKKKVARLPKIHLVVPDGYVPGVIVNIFTKNGNEYVIVGWPNQLDRSGNMFTKQFPMSKCRLATKPTFYLIGGEHLGDPEWVDHIVHYDTGGNCCKKANEDRSLVVVDEDGNLMKQWRENYNWKYKKLNGETESD